MDEQITETTKEMDFEEKLEIKVSGCTESAQPFVLKYREEVTELGKIEAKRNLGLRIKYIQPWLPSFAIEIDGKLYVHTFRDVD